MLRCAVLLVTTLAAQAQAQTSWSTVEVGLGGSAAVAASFTPEWSAGPGIVAQAASSAYGGRVQATVAARPYATADSDLPDFRTVTATLGWGPGLRLGPVRVWAGGTVGVVQFRFERLDRGEFQNVSEIEAVVGAWARIEGNLAGPVWAWAEGRALRAALADPTALTSAGAGLAVRVSTPGWLRDALR